MRNSMLFNMRRVPSFKRRPNDTIMKPKKIGKVLMTEIIAKQKGMSTILIVVIVFVTLVLFSILIFIVHLLHKRNNQGDSKQNNRAIYDSIYENVKFEEQEYQDYDSIQESNSNQYIEDRRRTLPIKSKKEQAYIEMIKQ